MANKIIVCQTGARHRYLIPQLLEAEGILSRLYTDSNCFSFLGRLASCFMNIGVECSLFRRLVNRRPLVSSQKLFSTDILFFKRLFCRLLYGSGLKYSKLLYTGFSNQCKNWGIKDADCIYNMYFENLEFLEYAKKEGVKVVVDIYEDPMFNLCMIEEIQDRREYESCKPMLQNYLISHQIRMEFVDRLLELADYYTVPSSFVAQSLSSFPSFRSEKVFLLPYPSSIQTSSYNYHPKKYRLIWVGNEPLRKGLLYCAQANVILKKMYRDVDFRIIGTVSPALQETYPFNTLHFLGKLDKEQLLEEYCSAEAYVFPTLSEGFAGTIIEAASCGCPIITTHCSGVDIDSFPALFIRERDVDSIVQQVSLLFEDSGLRDNYSRQVYSYSKHFSPAKYESTLTSILKSI